MSPATPWTIAEVEEPLLDAKVRRRAREAMRSVLEELLRRGAAQPDLEVKATTLRLYWHNDLCGLSVDRAGVVRVWAWCESVTFGEPSRTWHERGTDVKYVVGELVLVAGLASSRPG